MSALCLVLALACGSDSKKGAPPPVPPGRSVLPVAPNPVGKAAPPPTPPPPVRSTSQQVAEAQARLHKATTQPSLGSPTRTAAPATGAVVPAAPATGAVAPAAPATGAVAAVGPDLDAHLQKSMAGAPQCLAVRPHDRAQKQLVIRIAAVVMGTGSVTRTEVSAPGLDEEELRCLDRMAKGVRFPAPVKDAPRRVSTSIQLDLQPAAPAAP